MSTGQLPTAIARLVDDAADRHGVPRPLARAVAWIESRGNSSAVSPKGAQGVMQLMPATAAALGVVNPMNAGENIDAGVKYLAQLTTRFGEPKGLAAYNWGPRNVSSHDVLETFPQQVQQYVHNVLARAEIELAQMGLGQPADPLADTQRSPPRQSSSASRSSSSGSTPEGGDDGC